MRSFLKTKKTKKFIFSSKIKITNGIRFKLSEYPTYFRRKPTKPFFHKNLHFQKLEMQKMAFCDVLSIIKIDYIL